MYIYDVNLKWQKYKALEKNNKTYTLFMRWHITEEVNKMKSAWSNFKLFIIVYDNVCKWLFN